MYKPEIQKFPMCFRDIMNDHNNMIYIYRHIDILIHVYQSYRDIKLIFSDQALEQAAKLSNTIVLNVIKFKPRLGLMTSSAFLFRKKKPVFRDGIQVWVTILCNQLRSIKYFPCINSG